MPTPHHIRCPVLLCDLYFVLSVLYKDHSWQTRYSGLDFLLQICRLCKDSSFSLIMHFK